MKIDEILGYSFFRKPEILKFRRNQIDCNYNFLENVCYDTKKMILLFQYSIYSYIIFIDLKLKSKTNINIDLTNYPVRVLQSPISQLFCPWFWYLPYNCILLYIITLECLSLLSLKLNFGNSKLKMKTILNIEYDFNNHISFCVTGWEPKILSTHIMF